MTKDDLITAVKKDCSNDNISKRLTEDVVEATFRNIQKAIKKK